MSVLDSQTERVSLTLYPRDIFIFRTRALTSVRSFSPGTSAGGVYAATRSTVRNRESPHTNAVTIVNLYLQVDVSANSVAIGCEVGSDLNY